MVELPISLTIKWSKIPQFKMRCILLQILCFILKMTVKVNYDQDIDAAYFRLKNKTVLDSEEIADGIIIDY